MTLVKVCDNCCRISRFGEYIEMPKFIRSLITEGLAKPIVVICPNCKEDLK